MGGGDLGSAGPEVGAGVQGGQSSVQPGIADQGREAIHRGQDLATLAAHAEGMGIFWFSGQLTALATAEGLLKGLGGQLGGAATAGHGVVSFHI